MNAREVVRAHGGDWCGSYGLVPGPGHSPKDRSLKVSDYNGEIRVYSFAGDDWKACRAYLGLNDDRRRPRSPTRPPSLPARPSARVRDLLRTATTPDLVPDVTAYL